MTIAQFIGRALALGLAEALIVVAAIATVLEPAP